MIKFIIDQKYKNEWNRAVSHPLQTWEWGEARKENGNQIVRIGEFDAGGKLKRAIFCTVHKMPFGYTVVNCARSDWPSLDLLEFIGSELKKRRNIFVKLEPEVFREAAGLYKIPLLKKKWHDGKFNYEKSNSRVFAEHTFVVDLNLPEDKLLANMKSKTRYNIRLAEKKGVVVRDVTNQQDGFDTFYELYKQTIQRQNYLGHSYEYHKTVFERMRIYSTLLIAYFEDKPLAAYYLMFFNKKAYYVYGGSSEENKEVMASNLLMWKALQIAKQKGCVSFDMWGALPEHYDQKDPWAGFHRFKEGYGGVHKDYIGSVDVVMRPTEYRIFSVLWPLRTAVLEFKQRLSR
ncbi:MAG: peptidoglycan bridge formation glycyltransferase FemA/FemB family protein [Patescibacteria group bacterium]|jgi:lipid II:glycine glycyltransferase (peptidoglycan interpeptide bridge formation enzyme)